MYTLTIISPVVVKWVQGNSIKLLTIFCVPFLSSLEDKNDYDQDHQQCR